MSKSLFQNALYNAMRVTCSIAIPLITYPYATRVLLANQFGKYNFSQSVVSYFSLIAALGITNYAAREGVKYKEDKNSLSKFASEIFTINLVSTVVAVALLVFLICVWERIKGCELLIAVQALGIISTTVSCEWMNIIHEDYRFITIRTIIAQIMSAVLIFACVHAPQDVVQYAVANVLPLALTGILNFFWILRYATVRPTFTKDALRHIRPILLLFGSTLATSVYLNTDVTLLGIFQTDNVVGYYSVATKIYSVIKGLLNALTMVLLPRSTRLLTENKKCERIKLLQLSFHCLIIISIPVLFSLFLYADIAVWFIGGASYVSAIRPLRILCFAGLPAIIACFLQNAILLPERKEHLVFLATTSAAVANILLNLCLIPIVGATGAAITTLIAEIVVMTLMLNRRAIKILKNHIIPDLITVIVYCLILSLLYKFFICNIDNTIYSVLALLTCPILFVIVLYARNDILLKRVISLVFNAEH